MTRPRIVRWSFTGFSLILTDPPRIPKVPHFTSFALLLSGLVALWSVPIPVRIDPNVREVITVQDWSHRLQSPRDTNLS